MEKIPDWVKVSPKELCLDGYEINMKYTGEKIYVMMIDNDASINMIACQCPHLKCISFYANYFDVFKTHFEPEEVILAKVNVMDSTNLPFEAPEGETIFLIYEDWYLMEHESMADVTSDIETVISTHRDASIKDFCILMGNELPDGLKKSLLNYTKKIKDEKECKNAKRHSFTTAR